MYEIRIPKSELEHYDPDESLGIIVGGYGTMAFPNTNWWVFSELFVNLLPELSNRYLHYDMLGCESPPSPPGPVIHGYQLYLFLSIIGLRSILLIRKKYRNPN